MAKIKALFRKVIRQLSSGNSPDFIIIGVQKAGTSSLYKYLMQHPNLTSSHPKELHYFDRLVNFGYPIEWYNKQFIRKSLKSQLYFEASPNYFYSEHIARQIKDHFPNIKLIVVLRDPVSRAFSAWNMYKSFFFDGSFSRKLRDPAPGKKNDVYQAYYENRESFPNFMEAISFEVEIIGNTNEMEPAILRRGLYADQLENYYKYFDPSNILIVGFKDLITSLSDTLNKVTDFLGVSSLAIEYIDSIPKNTGVYTETMTSQEKQFLEEFYREPNGRLFKLLGYHPNW